ncbi:5828_t:CDS:10 [Scutellospora calospora]|uniref:5828_t:CDS:1 n=1 Tax=Scutellospora calospora TaxID=85575 RepID=A0ACA9KUJ9_9GLOM|nr:5828_t:CDS:10 [Scutellospora calospora]
MKSFILSKQKFFGKIILNRKVVSQTLNIPKIIEKLGNEDYPLYAADEIPVITPHLTNYLLPVSPNISTNFSYFISPQEPSGLHIFNAESYPNGPIILRLIRNSTNNCSEPYLHLRLIYTDINQDTSQSPNATSSNISFSTTDINIPDFNLCPISNSPPRDLIRIFPLSYNHTMIAFLRNNTGNGTETHQEFGIFIDWEGKVIQNDLNLGAINFTTVDSLGTLVVDSSQRYGFIWVNRVGSQNEFIRWTKYSISNHREVSTSYNQSQFSINPSHNYKIVATIDGGYCFVMAGPSANNNSVFNDVKWMASVVFIRPNFYTTQPSIIYQYFSQAVSMTIEACDNTYYDPGLACIFRIKPDNTSTISASYVKVAFFSSGGLKSSAILNITDTTFILNNVYQLWSGGYLLVVRLNTNNTYIGYIYDTNGNFSQTWNLPTVPGNITMLNGVFQNNTIWTIFYANNTTLNTSNWALATTISPKYIKLDHVIDNLNINITFPNLTDSSDSLLTGIPINITFYNSIILSSGNITIYQDTGKDLIRRLYYNAKNNSDKFVISRDSKTISISVLNSTFVSPASRYYVVMDNNFVKDLISDEPLMSANWTFTTSPQPIVNRGDSAFALIRLNVNESFHVMGLSSSDRWNYFQNLSLELSQAVPINSSNLLPVNQFQWDKDVGNQQILLKFQILPGNNTSNNITVTKIIETLNDLITNRDVTMISSLPSSSKLDSKYGFRPKKSVWDTYGYYLILIGMMPVFLAFLSLFSYQRGDDGKNFIPFKIMLIIFDFIIDMLFVLIHSGDLFQLYYPSVICFIVSLGFNIIVSFFLLVHELSEETIQPQQNFQPQQNSQPQQNTAFYSWFRKYHNVAAITTLCSAIDIEILTLIDSNIANNSLFNAQLSDSSEHWISRASCVNFFIEDAFQLAIQYSSSKQSDHIEIIPSSLPIVPETSVRSPRVWIQGNHGIPKTHLERSNLPTMPPLGRNNKVSSTSMFNEEPQITNIESINNSLPGRTVTYLGYYGDSEDSEEFEDVTKKRYKIGNGIPYEQLSDGNAPNGGF